MSAFIPICILLVVGFSFTDSQLHLLEQNILATVAVITNDGMPHLTPVMVILQDMKIYFSTRISREKYRCIQSNPSIGVNIIHPKSHKYVSFYGKAKIRTRDDHPVFDDIIARIIRKYIQDYDKATKTIQKLLGDDERVLIEIHPQHILAGHH